MRRHIYILLVVSLMLLQPAAFANASEPPSLIVILSNAPENTTVMLVNSDSVPDLDSVETMAAGLHSDLAMTVVQGRSRQVAWESYEAFYHHDFSNAIASLYVQTGSEHYLLTIPPALLGHYNSIVTLDVTNHTLTAGKLLSRNCMLVFLRVSLTLLLEGIMLYLFGFRKKRSWLCFFIVNLVTQGVLNYLLIAISPYNGYAIFSLVFYEFWIIIIETVTFGICLNEQRLLRRVLYAVTANLASLFLGGYLILMLPV